MSVKRKEFLKHLAKYYCSLYRNGGKHDIYKNEKTNKHTTIPRHPTIDRNLAQLICKQLGIPKMQ